MTTPKRIFLTGASNGMGKLIALTLAGQGHVVFAGMRELKGRNAPQAQELAAHRAAVPITPVDIDVTDDASVARCAATVLEQAGGVDVLINCAGIMWLGTTEAFSSEQFERTLQTNVVGPFRLFRAILPAMRAAEDGLLITVTSLLGRIVLPNFGIYCASKFATEAMAEAISYETAGFGIDSVIVEPGSFDTGLLAAQNDPANAQVVAAYGSMSQFHNILSAGLLEAKAQNPAAYDPQIVANLVSDLIAMPKGTRPLRCPVGQVGVVPELNRRAGELQAQFISQLGLTPSRMPDSVD